MANEDTQQLPLFPTDGAASAQPTSPLLDGTATLNQTLGAFEKYMQQRGFTENTQQAFRLDMELLSEYLGPAQQIGQISTATLNAFLKWMEDGQGHDVPCSPKTLERRITTLKVFFGWLAEEGSLPRDVSAPLIHHAVSAPLPDTLSDEELAALQQVTQARRRGDEENEPDARSHLLLTLILHTGIKKGECVSIHLNHLDLTRPERPALWVRYKNPRRRHKERRVLLPPWWPTVLDEYLEQYEPQQNLFPWSARNLEYVLTGVAKEAGVARITFEMLRWTCAVHDYVAGMPPEELRVKLGLSEISWYEVEVKLALLARRHGGRPEQEETQ